MLACNQRSFPAIWASNAHGPLLILGTESVKGHLGGLSTEAAPGWQMFAKPCQGFSLLPATLLELRVPDLRSAL